MLNYFSFLLVSYLKNGDFKTLWLHLPLKLQIPSNKLTHRNSCVFLITLLSLYQPKPFIYTVRHLIILRQCLTSASLESKRKKIKLNIHND